LKKESFIQYGVIWTLSVAVSFFPLFYTNNSGIYATFLPAIVSILILILADHLNARGQRTALRDDISKVVALAVTDAQVVTDFTLAQAHDYVVGNAHRAGIIYNTRLTDRTKEDERSPHFATRKAQDLAILNAVKAGSEYNLVCDQSHFAEVNALKEAAGRARAPVRLSVTPINGRNHPLIQFFVLDYGAENKECLVGYGLANDPLFEKKIHLVRSASLADFLIEVHTAYSRLKLS